MTERDRLNSSLRTYESELHTMEKKENVLSNQIRDKDLTEERINTMTKEIATLGAKLKVRHRCTPREGPWLITDVGAGWKNCRCTSPYRTSRTRASTSPGGTESQNLRSPDVVTRAQYERR